MSPSLGSMPRSPYLEKHTHVALVLKDSARTTHTAESNRDGAIDNVPNELMAQYYAQRASVGLIVSEGTSPSPNGLGYARIPGIFSAAQTAGWKLTADAVHAKG